MTVAESVVVMAKPVGPVCNFDCGYCYYLKKTGLFGPGERYRMGHDVLEAYVATLIAASPGPDVHFVWHGGEPTLAGIPFYAEALALQERYLPAGWSCENNIQTNGSLLDDAWCAFLAEHRFTVGLSIDGPARLHDAGRPDRRGRPTHDRVMRGLRNLRAHGIEPDVLCTLNAQNVAYPTEVYRFFLREDVRWLQFLPVVGRGADDRVSDWSVSAEAMGEFLCSVFDEWVRYDVGRIGVQNFLEGLLVATGRPANLCVVAETCGRALAVEHDGVVYSCDHFVDPAHRLGDVAADGIAALVGGMSSGDSAPRSATPYPPAAGRARCSSTATGVVRRTVSSLPRKANGVSTTCPRATADSSGTSSPTSTGWPRSRNWDDTRPRSWASSASPRRPNASVGARPRERPLPVRKRSQVQALLPAEPPRLSSPRRATRLPAADRTDRGDPVSISAPMNGSVAFICAMPMELAPLKRRLSLRRTRSGSCEFLCRVARRPSRGGDRDGHGPVARDTGP